MENKYQVFSEYKDSGIDMLGTLLFDCKAGCKGYRESRKDSESHHTTSSFLHAFSRNLVCNDGSPLKACGDDGVLDDGE